ncbi:MAG: hypothetical protein J5814_09285 [Bacteroidaceae bacterium]|nr:hypothetical protein [Bacteroidaceae bacterium]
MEKNLDSWKICYIFAVGKGMDGSAPRCCLRLQPQPVAEELSTCCCDDIDLTLFAYIDNDRMKKLGLFLLKNNIHVMTLIFVGWAVWAACHWGDLLLVQKLVLGLYGLLVVHEYEEGYKSRFLALMLGRVMGIDHRTLKPGVSHIAQALYITIIFSVALLFPERLWLTFAVLILGLFEGFVHTMGIFVFRLKGVSPGWWTAVLMAAYSIWAIVVINRNIAYDGIQWLWGAGMFIACFLCLEVMFQRLIGNSLPQLVRRMRAFVFGKR